MKKRLLIIFSLLVVISSYSSCTLLLIPIIKEATTDRSGYSGNIHIHGSWKWDSKYWHDMHGSMSGDYDDITFYDSQGNFLFRFKIYSGSTFYKKTKIWTEYRGTMEYYVNDNYPTIYSYFSKLNYRDELFIPSSIGKVKRTAEATITMAPYKKHPKTYNIWFDDVGFGFSLGGQQFKNSAWVKQFGDDSEKMKFDDNY